MIKIRALNRESLSDEEAPTIRREAQEEIVLEQYNIALRNQAKQHYQESIEILQKLIEGNIPELENNGGLPKSMSTIKFSCYFNLGNSYLKLNNINKALETFSTAAELDSTDVTLWCKIGKLSLKEDKFRKAAYAFSKGLECSESHWPCLDNLISVLYAIKDTIACLVYIGKALVLDADYIKGLVLRKQIYGDNPATKEFYQLYNPDYIWEPPLDIVIDKEDENLVLREAQKLCERVTEIEKSLGPKPVQTIPLPKALEDFTWVALANCITGLHEYISENEMSHFTMIDLKRCMSQSSNSENSLPKSEKFISEKPMPKSDTNTQDSKHSKSDEKSCNEEKISTDVECVPSEGKELEKDGEKMDVELTEVERRGSLASESNAEGQETVTPVQTDNDEDQAMDVENDNNENNDIETDGEDQKAGRGRPKGTKRKRDVLSDLQIWGWHSKRKQPKKVARDYIVEDALNRIIPKSLLKSKLTSQESLTAVEDSMNTMDLYNMYVDEREINFLSPIHSPKSVNYEAFFGTDREKDDVLKFWNKERDCVDAVTLVKELVFELSLIWHYKWPKDLVPLYLKAFNMLREHCDPPQPFCSGLPFDKIKEDALATLLFAELSAFSTESGKENHPTILGYLQMVSGWQEDWKEEFLQFFIRFYWLQSHIFRKHNDNDLAINALEMILEVICEEEEKIKEKFTLYLPNCFKYGFVSKQITEKFIKHLNMVNALSSIENLYNGEKYAEVADIIKQTFSAGSSFSKIGRMGRPAQLGLLLHSLWFTNLEDCFLWTEECLHESVQNFRKPNSDQDKWEKVIDKCLGILHEIIKKETVTVVDLLSEDKRCRLIESLSKIVCYQLNSEFALVMPLGCVTPWILMHYILLREEQRQYANKRKTLSKRDIVESQKDAKEDSSEENDEELPPSIAVLFSAHEFLGPKGWCLTNKGELLLFILDTVLDRLDTPVFEPIREKIEIHIEQALFCLYMYPSKKNKISRHLVDHNVNPLPLTWERSFQLYQYYGPDTVPEFNDIKSASISGDLENLLRRIIALVPSINDLHSHLPKIMNYIYNKADEIPAALDFPNRLRAIYYLIGDFHFKQGDVNRCIKYFQLDLCINPDRLDSWACLALSYANQLELKLNHCEDIKNDSDFLERAKSAEKCFHRALEINSDHLTLWIERGSFEYTVHSICSRMIKYESENYSMEKFEILENEKETFLDSSGNSLQKAIAIYETEDNGEADERWLQYYILGKIAEKKKQEPMEYLQYYLTACNLLHENKATYPERINYNNPQHLSVEALEMHYRIHASVLKYLELHEGKDIPNTLGDFFKRCIGITEEHFKPPPPPVAYVADPKLKENEGDISDDNTKEDIKTCINDIINKVEAELNSKIEVQDKLKEKIEEKEVIELKTVTNDEDDEVVLIDDNDDDIIILDSDDEIPNTDSKIEEKREVNIEKTEIIEKLEVIEKTDTIAKTDDEGVSEVDDKDNKPSENTIEPLEEAKDKEMEDVNAAEDVVPMETESVQEPVKIPKITDVQSFLDKMMEETMKNITDDDDPNNSSFEQVEEVTLPNESSPEETSKTEEKVEDKKEDDADLLSKSKTPDTDTEPVKNSATENDSSSTSSSSSSSSDSSSSDSDNDSSSDSSSSEDESSENMSNSEILHIVDKCIQGLEACCLRLEGNYKALYRLAHVFFNYKARKDYTKCKQILLGEFRTKDGRNTQGLFFERKMSNFFSGIWRIPCTEIDRPGSLAAHMNRCISLLLQVLRNTNDTKTLIELCLQLKKEPDRDKIYIKNSDRLAFSEQAMNMCLQSFRSQIKNMSNMSNTQMLKILHDIFRAHQKVQKHFTSKEGLISSLLVDAYKSFIKEKIPDNVNILDLAVKFCQQHKPLEKHRNSSSGASSAFLGRSPGVGTSPVLPSPSSLGQQHASKRPSLGRPRGRPPLPKMINQTKQPKSKNPVAAATNLGAFGAWSNQNFTYEYLKQYQDQLIKQYSQNMTYSQMAQLSQMMNQGQLSNPAMASAVTNQFLAGTGLLTSSAGLLPAVSSSGIVTSNALTSSSLLDNQSLINSVFKSGVTASSLAGMSTEQLTYLESILKATNKGNKPSSSKSGKHPSNKLRTEDSSKLSKYPMPTSKKSTGDKMLMKDRPSISITPVGNPPTSTSLYTTSTKSSNKQEFSIIPNIPSLCMSNAVTTTILTKSGSGLYASSSKSNTILTSASSTKISASSNSYPTASSSKISASSNSYTKSNSLLGLNPFGLPGNANVSKSTSQSSIPFGIPTVNFAMPNIGATITPSIHAFPKQNFSTSPKTTRVSAVMSPSARGAISTSPSPTQYGETSSTSFTKPTSTSPGKTLQEKLADKKKEQNTQMMKNAQESSTSAALLKTLNLPTLPSNLSVSMATGTTGTFSQAEIRSGVLGGTYPTFGMEKLPSSLSVSKTATQQGQNIAKPLFKSDSSVSMNQVPINEPSKPLFKENSPKKQSSPSSKPISLTNEVEITFSAKSSKISPKNESISSKSITKPLISVKKDLFSSKPNLEVKTSSSSAPQISSNFVKLGRLTESSKNRSKPCSSSVTEASASILSISKSSSNVSDKHSKAISTPISSDALKSSLNIIKSGSKISSNKPKTTSPTQEVLKTLKKLPGINLSVYAPSTSKVLKTIESSSVDVSVVREHTAKKDQSDVICIDD